MFPVEVTAPTFFYSIITTIIITTIITTIIITTIIITTIISTVRCSIPPPTQSQSNPIPSTFRFGCFKPFYGNLNQLRQTIQDHPRPLNTIEYQ